MTRVSFILKNISINFIKSFFILSFLFSLTSFTQAETAETRKAEAEVAAKSACGGENNFNCYTLLESYDNGGDSKQSTVIIKAGGLGEYLETIMTYFLMIVTIAAVFFMIYGGILYLTTDIVNKKAEGKEVITRVVIGLIFVFSVWTIMNSINSGLLKNSLDFSLKGIGVAVKGAVTGNTSETPQTPPSTGATTPTPTPAPAGAIRSCPEGLETVSGSFQLCKTVAQNMKNMIAAAKSDGIDLVIVSAYRSQNSGGVSSGTVAPDGKSMHQPGLAVDFGGNFKRGPATDKRFVWLVNNAAKYGFYNILYKTKTDEYNHWSTSGR